MAVMRHLPTSKEKIYVPVMSYIPVATNIIGCQFVHVLEVKFISRKRRLKMFVGNYHAFYMQRAYVWCGVTKPVVKTH